MTSRSRTTHRAPDAPLAAADHAHPGWVPDVRRIAVLRANAIGDFIFALPALEALRAAYPAAEITLLGKAWHAGFLANRPSPVDRVIPVPRSRGVSENESVADDPAELEQFFAAMRRERFDIAVQIHGGGRYSNPFVRRLGARLTVGLKTPDAAPLDRWVPYIYYHPEVLRYLEVVSRIGAPMVTLEPRLAVTAADLDESRRVVPDADRPIVTIHPGAGDPRRRWPAEKFGAVGDALVAAGARVCVVGTEPERPLVEGVIGAMRTDAVDLCGRLTLGGLVGLLARSRVVVANDSGPMHLARAVGAATVAVYWCGNLIAAGPATRTRHRPAIAWRLTCPDCGLDCTRDECHHRSSFVAEVPVEEVRDPALDLLCTTVP
jgi:ADP-heptose:LPS heptosyltransferase